jgi:hypothetical protein
MIVCYGDAAGTHNQIATTPNASAMLFLIKTAQLSSLAALRLIGAAFKRWVQWLSRL